MSTEVTVLQILSKYIMQKLLSIKWKSTKKKKL